MRLNSATIGKNNKYTFILVLNNNIFMKSSQARLLLQAIESSQLILREVVRRVGDEEEGELPLANIRRLVASYDMGKLTGDSGLCSSVFRSYRIRIRHTEERMIQKKGQRSLLLIGGQNLLNSLPR